MAVSSLLEALVRRREPGLTTVPGSITVLYNAADMRVVDFTDALSEIPEAHRIVNPIDHYPSALMHEIAAREMATSLRGARLVPDGG